MINFDARSFTIEGVSWFAIPAKVDPKYYIIDCVDNILYFRAVPTTLLRQSTNYLVVDCIDSIIYYRSAIVSKVEYDGAFSGTCLVAPLVSSAKYSGIFSGIVILSFYSQLQYNGVFSGICKVSRSSNCSYNGNFIGSVVVSSTVGNAPPCQYNGQFSGVVVPLANVASEACISGPGNPVVAPLANLMF